MSNTEEYFAELILACEDFEKYHFTINGAWSSFVKRWKRYRKECFVEEKQIGD